MLRFYFFVNIDSKNLLHLMNFCNERVTKLHAAWSTTI